MATDEQGESDGGKGNVDEGEGRNKMFERRGWRATKRARASKTSQDAKVDL